jgi:lipopolysaccharide biosynthesis protein
VVRRIEDDFSIAVPLEFRIPSYPQARIAVICHVFHVDLAEEIHRTLTNIKFRADLFVSTDTPGKLDVLKSVFGGWGNGAAELRLVPNRGRDVAPKFVTFRAALESYDLLLFLHSKKSGHRETGSQWREMLFQTLVGSPEIVASIIYAFYRFPSLGVIFPQHCEHVREYVQWLGNFYIARRLAHRMGFKLKSDGFLDFPSGSMFWARSAALRPLVQLGLQIRDFPEEKGQIDGTAAHAIERLVLYACEHAGFSWMKVADPSFFSDRSTVVTIATPDELDDFVVRRRVTLLTRGNRGTRWSARLVRLRSGVGRLLNAVGH